MDRMMVGLYHKYLILGNPGIRIRSSYSYMSLFSVGSVSNLGELNFLKPQKLLFFTLIP